MLKSAIDVSQALVYHLHTGCSLLSHAFIYYRDYQPTALAIKITGNIYMLWSPSQ